MGANVVPEQGVVRTVNTNNGIGFTLAQKQNSDEKILYDVNVVGNKIGLEEPKSWHKNIALLSTMVTGVLECCVKSDNPDIDIDFIKNIGDPYRTRDIKSAFLSWGYLLRKSITNFLDINDTELRLDFFVSPKEKIPGVYLIENLVNGAGYTTFIANANSTGLSEEEQKKILCDTLIDENSSDSLYSIMSNKTHSDNCECSCYDCLRDYYNQRQHNMINWRLGLDVAKVAATDETPVYLGNYWEALIKARLVALESIEKITYEITPEIVLITFGNDKYLLYHPLWSESRIEELAKNYGATKCCNIIDFIQKLQLSETISIDKKADSSSQKKETENNLSESKTVSFAIDDWGSRIESYSAMWEELPECNNDSWEKKLRSDLNNKKAILTQKELPNTNTVILIEDEKVVPVALVWEKSKIIYFPNGELADYNLFKAHCPPNWTCFYGNDESVTAGKILEKLVDK